VSGKQQPSYRTFVSFGAHKDSGSVHPASPAIRVAPPVRDDFDRFEQLTSSLVKVPKSEIDKQRADG
jgi:hypothetical protein